MSSAYKLLIFTFYVGVVTWLVKPVENSRILAFSPISGRSHWNFMKGILRALTDHGHRVTVFTPFPIGNRENYTEVDLSNEISSILHFDIELVHKILTHPTDLVEFVSSTSRDTCKTIYENKDFKNIIKGSNPDFDIVFVEIMASECISYLNVKLNIPLVYVSPPPLISYVERSVLGQYPNPAVVAHLLADYSIPRTFMERFSNTLLLVYTSTLLRCKIWYASIVDRQPFDQVEPIKPSLVFSNNHFITDSSRPLPQNVIPIGGIHLGPSKKIPEVSLLLKRLTKTSMK